MYVTEYLTIHLWQVLQISTSDMSWLYFTRPIILIQPCLSYLINRLFPCLGWHNYYFCAALLAVDSLSLNSHPNTNEPFLPLCQIIAVSVSLAYTHQQAKHLTGKMWKRMQGTHPAYLCMSMGGSLSYVQRKKFSHQQLNCKKTNKQLKGVVVPLDQLQWNAITSRCIKNHRFKQSPQFVL